MLLLILTLTISFAGLVAIELGQAPRPRQYTARPREYAARPREYTAWNDDIERRLLRLHPGSSNRW
jgi:hypothetical protein